MCTKTVTFEETGVFDPAPVKRLSIICDEHGLIATTTVCQDALNLERPAIDRYIDEVWQKHAAKPVLE